MPREVPIGSHIIGGVRIPVIAGTAGGGDLVRYDARATRCPDAATARLGDPVQVPLVAETDPASESFLDDVPAYVVRESAAPAVALLVSAGRVTGEREARALAATRLPVILRRPASTGVREWLVLAERLGDVGISDLMLCEGGDELSAPPGTARCAPDLAVLRQARTHTDAPVLVDVSGAPDLVAAAVAAGADGLMLGVDAEAAQGVRAVELATTLSSLLGRAREPATLDEARQAIDQVDAGLANLLERRAELAGAVQQLKPVGGFAGRDPQRENDVVAAMARRAPRLGLTRIRRIMEAVIEAGLELAESQREGASEVPERAESRRGVSGTNVRRAG